MLANAKQPAVHAYVSGRVYDGVRPMSPALLQAVRDNHNKNRTMTVVRFVRIKVAKLVGAGRALLPL